MTEYVKATPLRPLAPIHIVREFGESLRVITECGRELFWPEFTEEPTEPYVCVQCWNRTQK